LSYASHRYPTGGSLATRRGRIPTTVLDEYVYLTHVDPADLSVTLVSRPRYVRTWRLSHLGAKVAFLRAGLGFGGMPPHLVEADLASGTLVEIAPKGMPPGVHMITMSAIYRTDSPPSPRDVGSSSASNKKTYDRKRR
jgi:DNA-binding transcriptional LysR family regulator